MRRNSRDSQKGSALVDFALSLIIVLSVLFGIIDVGRALYAYDWVANAARKGSRFMEVRGTPGCLKNPHLLSGGCPATATDATNYITNANGNGIDTTGINANQLTVTSLCRVTGSIGTQPPCADTTWVQVKVTYNFKFITPFLAVAFPSGWDMHSSSEVIVQN